jgi:hypothetical protein
MKYQWTILVGQMVLGKSKAPERAGNVKWRRHKPYTYRNGRELHEILYSKSFTAIRKDALEEADRVKRSMFDTYLMGMGKTDVSCIKEYSIILHNCTNDEAVCIDATIDIEDDKIWNHRSDSRVSTRKLISIGVISSDPRSRNYQILTSKERPINKNSLI